MSEKKADYARINNTLGKMAYHLASHNSICVGVSGGSDSNIIVHMIATYFKQYLPKIHFVFENTGLEYKATLKHLDDIEKYYNIKIDRIKGESVVTVVRREGLPILSKRFSYTISYAKKGSAWALSRLGLIPSLQKYPPLSHSNISLGTYLINHNIPVSSKCCDLSKKKPYHKYLKQIKADLTISGERRAEGGQRAIAHKNCFEPGKIDKYMPLFFWDDETKQYYKERERITYSDCYEVWGMKRTGCVGCPFSSRVGDELKIMKQHEPNLYKACMNVFGESYRLMDKFKVHRNKILDENE